MAAGCFVLDHAQMGASCQCYGGEWKVRNEDRKHKMSRQPYNEGKTRVSIQSQNKPKPVLCPKLEQDPGAHVRAQMEQIEFC